MSRDERIFREHEPDDFKICLMTVREDSSMRDPGRSVPLEREGGNFAVQRVTWSFRGIVSSVFGLNLYCGTPNMTRGGKHGMVCIDVLNDWIDTIYSKLECINPLRLGENSSRQHLWPQLPY